MKQLESPQSRNLREHNKYLERVLSVFSSDHESEMLIVSQEITLCCLSSRGVKLHRRPNEKSKSDFNNIQS